MPEVPRWWSLGVVSVLLGGQVCTLAWAQYNSRGKRDPFVPLVTSEGRRIYPPGLDEAVDTGVSGLTLQGIVFDSKAGSVAIINNQIVREKEEVDGMKVLKIRPTSVTMLVEGQPHQLVLPQLEEEITEEP